MGKEKRLTIALAFCGLSLCIAVGALAHVYQESREQGECLTAAQRQIEVLETQLSQVTKETAQMEERLALAEAEKAEAEEERDYAQRQYEVATGRDNPIDKYYDSDKRPRAMVTYEVSVEASFYLAAWHRELEKALEWVEKDCGTTYEADYKLLSDYRSTVETVAELMSDLQHLHFAQYYAPEERWGHGGTFEPIADKIVRARIYRQATFDLLKAYLDDGVCNYTYSFDDIAVEEILGNFYGGGEEGEMLLKWLFPSISQVLPD